MVWVQVGKEFSDVKQNENQTVLAGAIHTPNRNAGSLEGAVAGSWNLGVAKQSQGEGCC